MTCFSTEVVIFVNIYIIIIIIIIIIITTTWCLTGGYYERKERKSGMAPGATLGLSRRE
jgi:uncharacterized ion transporter superfamily protein YfcC